MKGNWKTSIFGILLLIAQSGRLVGVPEKVVNAATVITAAGGLLVAKDGDVTGGTRTPQGDEVVK